MDNPTARVQLGGKVKDVKVRLILVWVSPVITKVFVVSHHPIIHVSVSTVVIMVNIVNTS